MKVLQYVYLGVSSETLDPATITQRIGIGPDRVEVRASRSVDPPRPVANRWRLDASPGGTVDDRIDEMLARIEPCADRLAELTAAGEVAAVIEVVRHLGHPDGDEEEARDVGSLQKLPGQHQLLGFALSTRTLTRLVDLGLSLDFDEYG
ncbi:MAG TPA: DUF4279 domain-containing protein [Iamia sp.]|nr:DUF4279 domain-containing protein [Iamia sp.]